MTHNRLSQEIEAAPQLHRVSMSYGYQSGIFESEKMSEPKNSGASDHYGTHYGTFASDLFAERICLGASPEVIEAA